MDKIDWVELLITKGAIADWGEEEEEMNYNIACVQLSEIPLRYREILKSKKIRKFKK